MKFNVILYLAILCYERKREHGEVERETMRESEENESEENESKSERETMVSES